MKDTSRAERPTVVVAEDDTLARERLVQTLRAHGMEVHEFDNGQDALNRVLAGGVDLVLLDVMMPVLGGLECCRVIKAHSKNEFVPVVLLTVKNDTGSRVEGLRMGADDYLGKPFDARELFERVNTLLRIKKMHDDLARAKAHLEELAIHDDLTGLYNYRHLNTRLEEEFKRAQRYGHALSCTMIDIDHFKQVNDAHGHDAGDRVLREVAERMRATVREVDILARYGGEEFLIIMPQTRLEQARFAAERVRNVVASRPIELAELVHEITMSGGVAVYPAPHINNKDDLLRAADRALYRAKADGRNRVCIADCSAAQAPSAPVGASEGS